MARWSFLDQRAIRLSDASDGRPGASGPQSEWDQPLRGGGGMFEKIDYPLSSPNVPIKHEADF